MLETQNKKSSPLEPKICPYLGVHEDRETSFAFPSTWNCCHLSRRVSPVTLELQRAQCLTGNYSQCPVYMGGEKVSLPSEFRLKHRVESSQRRLGWVFLFLILVVGAWVSWAVSSGDFPLAMAGLWSGMRTAVPALGGFSSSTPASVPAAATMSDIPTPAPVAAQASNTPEPTAVAPVVSQALNSSPTATASCGYGLDVTINSGKYKFVIHKISEGESIDLLETRFDTTKNAIQAANYFLPMPLWVDRVIVVPVGSADLVNMPAFEPYYVNGASVSLEGLAKNLSATASELKEYNGWNSVCQVFSGWMLVPRERTSP